MTISQRAVEAAAEAMREGIAQDNPLKAAQAALTAALTVDGVALQGWQPIESAPREETILVAGGDAIYPVTASWSGLSDECWCIDGQEDVHQEIGWPTHWMPLPQSPAASDGEERK